MNLRVGFVSHSINDYGASRSLLDLVCGLRERGVDSFVVIPGKGRMQGLLASHKIPHKLLPMTPWLKKSSSFPNDFDSLDATQSAGYIARAFDEWQIELVHTNSMVTPVGAMAAFLRDTPHVWHAREFGDLDFGLKWVFGKQFAVNCFRQSAFSITVSEAIDAHYQGEVANCPSKVIYNGVGSAAAFERRRHTIVDRAGQEFIFALVGKLGEHKGQIQAVNALARIIGQVKGAKLYLVGEGNPDYRDALNIQIKRLGLAHAVTLFGHVEEVGSIYRNSDAVLMCSPMEAMGRVTVEAMSHGKPVIGYASGGTAELIEHERTGLLYSAGEDELAECMLHLAQQPGVARELGESAWEHTRNHFTTEHCAREVDQVYQSVLATGATYEAGHATENSVSTLFHDAIQQEALAI